MAEISKVHLQSREASRRTGTASARELLTALDHFVKLDALPDGLQFPDDLQKKVSFDPGKKRLAFHGFMCKADYDRLARLHADVKYRQAIDRLFQISTDAESPQLRRLGLVLLILAILCLILAAVVWWELLRVPSGPSNSRSSPSSASGQVAEKGVARCWC